MIFLIYMYIKNPNQNTQKRWTYTSGAFSIQKIQILALLYSDTAPVIFICVSIMYPVPYLQRHAVAYADILFIFTPDLWGNPNYHMENFRYSS